MGDSFFEGITNQTGLGMDSELLHDVVPVDMDGIEGKPKFMGYILIA